MASAWVEGHQYTTNSEVKYQRPLERVIPLQESQYKQWRSSTSDIPHAAHCHRWQGRPNAGYPSSATYLVRAVDFVITSGTMPVVVLIADKPQ
jgi:hypothetical protein